MPTGIRTAAVFSIDPVTIVKDDDGRESATIGDTIDYTLTIKLPAGHH